MTAFSCKLGNAGFSADFLRHLALLVLVVVPGQTLEVRPCVSRRVIFSVSCGAMFSADTSNKKGCTGLLRFWSRLRNQDRVAIVAIAFWERDGRNEQLAPICRVSDWIDYDRL